MFRKLELPPTVSGTLYLHSMPGRVESFSAAKAELRRLRVSRVVCLNPPGEIVRKSPEYARAIGHEVPWEQVMLPVRDFGLPDDPDLWRETVRDVASCLRFGENVLVHCGAGIGRTGTFALGVLLAMGVSMEAAYDRVIAAGSLPESEEQMALAASVKPI